VAGALLKGQGMRFALLCLALAGCTLYLDPRDKKHMPPPPDAPEIQDAYYPRNTCPWPSPEPLIACSQVGASCDYEDWEHGCSCVCDASGWWKCTPETIGSTCPTPPPPDAAL